MNSGGLDDGLPRPFNRFIHRIRFDQVVTTSLFRFRSRRTIYDLLASIAMLAHSSRVSCTNMRAAATAEMYSRFYTGGGPLDSRPRRRRLANNSAQLARDAALRIQLPVSIDATRISCSMGVERREPLPISIKRK